VLQCIVMLNPPVLVAPPSNIFVNMLLQTLQNPLRVVLVNHIAWGNKFLMNNVLSQKKLTNTVLVSDLTHLIFFRHG